MTLRELEPSIADKTSKPFLEPTYLCCAEAYWLNPGVPCVFWEASLFAASKSKIYKMSLWGRERGEKKERQAERIRLTIMSIPSNFSFIDIVWVEWGLQREAGSDRWCRFQGIMLTLAAGINNLKGRGEWSLPCPDPSFSSPTLTSCQYEIHFCFIYTVMYHQQILTVHQMH